MQPDTIHLVLGNQEITKVEEMSLTSDLYSPEGKWSMSLGSRLTARRGTRCQVYVNSQLELTGIVDSVEETEDRTSHTWTIEGVSLAGLLSRSYLTTWSAPPSTLKQAATKLLPTVPFVKDLEWTITGEDPSKPHANFDVGSTVFSVLNEFAQNRGLIFWAKADGSLVFGKAQGKGAPEFTLNSSSITKRRRREDGTNLHSEIHIVSDSDEDGHLVVVAKNPSVEFHLPFAAAYNGHDRGGLQKQADQYLRQEKLDADQLHYTVSGFSIAGSNWAINKRVHVVDDRFGIDDTLLVRSRTFRRSRATGSTTDLVLTPILAEDVFKAYPKGREKERETW